MIKIRYFIYTLVLAFAVSLAIPDEADARRGGGFRGGGFRSSRASSWGSKSSSSSAWSSKARKSSSRSSSKAGMNRGSAADRALHQKAAAQGTVYKNRSEAQKAFSQKYSNQYPSRYPTKPAARPEHIPNSTTVDGKKFNVDYNPQYGGYGYFGTGGSWVAYSVIRDVTMMSMLMDRHNYYVDEEGNTQVERTSGIGRALNGLMIVIGILFAAQYFGRF